MAPHGQFILHEDGTINTSPPIPAERHKNYFQNVKSKVSPLF